MSQMKKETLTSFNRDLREFSGDTASVMPHAMRVMYNIAVDTVMNVSLTLYIIR